MDELASKVSYYSTIVMGLCTVQVLLYLDKKLFVIIDLDIFTCHANETCRTARCFWTHLYALDWSTGTFFCYDIDFLPLHIQSLLDAVLCIGHLLISVAIPSVFFY